MISMTDRNSKRKFQHLDSLISLILPLIFISVILVNRLIPEERSIPIAYPDKKDLTHSFYPYDESVPPERCFIVLKIRGESDSAMNELKKLVLPIYSHKDTINGVKIIFDKSAKYGQYIESINVLLKAKANTFAPLEDTIFVFYINRNYQYDDLDCNIPFMKAGRINVE